MSKEAAVKQPVLCYIKDNWAYFTTQDLHNQWGSGWDRTPYEHNSDEPDVFCPDRGKREKKQPWEIVKVVWEGNFLTPCSNIINSPWSVLQINAGAVAWLRTPPGHPGTQFVNIHAGTPLDEFCRLIWKGGGKVYLEYKIKP
jgi:hypothetical protein